MTKIPSQEEVGDAFEKSFAFKPKLKSWGFFAHDDAPGGIGGGLGNFSWFETLDSMLEFWCKFPLLAHSADGNEDLEWFNTVALFTAKVREAGVIRPSDFTALNASLRGAEQMTWHGQLEHLVSGSEWFAENLREEYAGTRAPLPPEQIPGFTQFLKAYGH